LPHAKPRSREEKLFNHEKHESHENLLRHPRESGDPVIQISNFQTFTSEKHTFSIFARLLFWIPAFAGMTAHLCSAFDFFAASRLRVNKKMPHAKARSREEKLFNHEKHESHENLLRHPRESGDPVIQISNFQTFTSEKHTFSIFARLLFWIPAPRFRGGRPRGNDGTFV